MHLNKVTVNSNVEAEMIKRAVNTLQRSHRIYDAGEKYSACVYTRSGNYYEGFSIFSSTHSLTIHAEQAAIINAILNHDEEIVAIAIVSTETELKPLPCGICRQLLYENARSTKLDIKIVCQSIDKIDRFNLSELYPHQWPDREPRKRT